MINIIVKCVSTRMVVIGGLFLTPSYSFSQAPVDSVDRESTLNEVTITSAVGHRQNVAGKGRSASIDEHLLQLSHVSMVRRGSYAWEPMVNSMTSERLSTTIDGMKIFYACTDRMDPVTSYVESGNLQRISLNAGLDGNPQATGNIGGCLDLKLRKAGFGASRQEYNANIGYETNGHLQVYGADAAFSTQKFYSNLGVFYRHADNYKAGGHEEVSFSQFSKVNTFLNIGWQPVANHIIEGTVIFDRATDVGYPALTMDVSDATGLITSLSYRQEEMRGWFYRWETKLYYNHIKHNMDDTTRPDVKVHMDMPGKSSTAGIYSLLQGVRGSHQYRLNYDAYYNQLFADMTMYVKGVAPMYMLTWPDVGTFNSGVSLSDDIALSLSHHLHLSTKISWQHRRINNDEGFRALSIYFTDMNRQDNRWSGRVAVSYAYHHGDWNLALGTGVGSRTPSVTESSGYFLNNAFDSYDYIGNPHLKNESAIELNASVSWNRGALDAAVEMNTFFFHHYIIGIPDTRLSPMTIGASGVKVYQNLSHARIMNVTARINGRLLPWLLWENHLNYSVGKESTDEYLPMIAPLTYTSKLKVSSAAFEAEGGVELVDRHRHFSAKYGESDLPGYAVWHLSAGYRLTVNRIPVHIHIGVENLFDKHYSTYADWNRIPQKGRNFYANIALQL